MDWFKLHEVCDVRDGTHDSPKYVTNGFPLVTSKNIVNGEIDISNVNYISEADLIKINQRSKVDNGDILMPMIGTIGKPLVVKKTFEFAIKNVALIKFYNNSKVLPKYVCYVLESSIFKKYVEKENRGGTQKFLSLSNIRNFKLPVPNIEIQNKIIDVLDTAMFLINKRKSQIAALDELTQSLFLEMFGDPKVNKNNYPIKSLVDFYDNPKEAVKCGPFGSALKKDEYVTEGIPVWNMDNITKQNEFIDNPSLFVTVEKAKELNGYNVKNGDIIISRAGTVGKMCVVASKNEVSIISTNLIRLRLNEHLKPEFLIWLIKIFGDKVCRMRTGNDGSFTHMNTGVLNSIEFPYPPINEQNRFVRFLEENVRCKTKLINSLESKNNLYNSLLHKAFKGELFQEQ